MGLKITQLIKSYLHNRSQYVSYNSQNSTTKHITCGVSQGSILRPIFFILYVNDVSNVSPKKFSILFADDTNIYSFSWPSNGSHHTSPIEHIKSASITLYRNPSLYNVVYLKAPYLALDYIVCTFTY